MWVFTIILLAFKNRSVFVLLDFTAPLSIPGSSTVNEESKAMIISMGFTESQAIKALKATVSTTSLYRDCCNID